MKVLIFALSLALTNVAMARECFNQRSIRGWTYDQATETLQLRASRGVTYEVTTSSCRQLAWAQTLGFKSFSTLRTCTGDEVMAIDSWGQVLQTCWIRGIVKK